MIFFCFHSTDIISISLENKLILYFKSKTSTFPFLISMECWSLGEKHQLFYFNHFENQYCKLNLFSLTAYSIEMEYQKEH